jgi:hypothetical protein
VILKKVERRDIYIYRSESEREGSERECESEERV